jgi:iron complex outermembrane receptor protein
MSRLSLLSGSAIAACAFVIGAPACAQEREFNISAGALGDALNQFAAQSDQQIFFSGDMVAGRRTLGLRGRYAPTAALARLLSGTGLVSSETRPGVIYLRRQQVSAQPEETTTEVDEVVVTGTLLRSAGAQASPVLTLDRDALDERGVATVAEALTDLPQNYSGSGTPSALLSYADPAGSNSVAATGVNLRGLGADATLVLVNGRRMAGTGSRGEFADVSGLPSAAVERVDVLLDGASALYGSDAVAGVVNVILRRSFDGQETRIRAGAAQGGAEDLTVSHLAGRSWSSGAALVSYEYQHVNALGAGDRAYTVDGDLRPFGGSDRRAIYSSPGNILAFDAAIGGYVPIYAIRPGPSGYARSTSDFAAGQANLQSQLLGVDLLPSTERHSVYGRVRQSLGDRLDLSADLRFSRRAYGFDNAAPLTIFQVSAANPFFVSPSGAASQLIGYSFFGDLGTSRQEGVSRSVGVTAGGSYDLGRAWSLDGYVAVAEERGESRTTGLVNSAFLNEALGNTADNPATSYSATRDGYFNPYGAGAANGPAVLGFISQGISGSVNRSRSESANLLLEGRPFHLPGGDLAIAFGLQARRETFDNRITAFTGTVLPQEIIAPSSDRTISAVFAEARIPFVGPENARPGVQRLELSLAGRVEEYDDFGRTSNPKVSLVWSPMTALNLKASWGTSFRAPALRQLTDATQAAPTFVKRADGTSVLSLYRYGGNPDLKPETAETWTTGFDYAPASGLRLSVSYFDTRFTNRIAQPVNENLSGALTDPALAPFVRVINPATNAADLALIRSFIDDPSYAYGSFYPAQTYGAILDARWVNASEADVRGIDLDLSYPWRLGDSTVSFDANASYILAYETRLTPASSSDSVVGQVGYPVRLRSRAGATWSRAELTAGVHWNHVSSYADALGLGIDAWDTADVQVTWAPNMQRLPGVRIVASIQNLFDSDPPFYDSPTGLGYDPGQGDLLGRVASLQLIKRW